MNAHPILGEKEAVEMVEITVNGKPYQAEKGDMIAAALLRNNIRINRYTTKEHKPRGIFCGIGQCTDCVMVVNGRKNVRTCITRVEPDMTIETQNCDNKES